MELVTEAPDTSWVTASNLRRAPLVTPLLLSLTLLLGVTHQAGANIGEGTAAADRQQLIYEINLARWNPPGYGTTAGLVWNGVMADPPLALNDQLLESAQIKADEMVNPQLLRPPQRGHRPVAQ